MRMQAHSPTQLAFLGDISDRLLVVVLDFILKMMVSFIITMMNFRITMTDFI